MRTKIYKYSILIICIAGASLLAACSGEEWHSLADGQVATRPVVAHNVTVSLGEPEARVDYQQEGDDLKLTWQESETLGVYIKQTDNNLIYAGTVSSNGAVGAGARHFTGVVSEKTEGESYVYLHPALGGETQGQTAQGTIDFAGQAGNLGSTAHLSNYVPLIWTEGVSMVAHRGYVVRLKLKFMSDPGTINTVTLRAMEGVGNDLVFPVSFDAATMAPSTTMKRELTLTVPSETATNNGDGTWSADAYLVCSHCDVNVFRTKYDVKVDASAGTFYFNEFRSFPGQEQAPSNTVLQMLADGKCHYLSATMSKDVATTVVSSQYKVNSLLGMWNEYGKVTDPFAMVKTTGLPPQLQTNILDKKDAFTDRTLINKSSQGSPTFTWTMVTRQCGGSYKQDNVTYNNIDIVESPTEVYVTFVSEYAWAQNLLGYYHYPTGSVPSHPSTVLKTIIFPNVSKGDHVPYNKGGTDGGANINPNTATANVGVAADAPLQEYTTVQLLYNNPDGTYSKEFPVGTTIGFFIMRDPKASSSGKDEGSMGDTSEDTHTGYTPRPDNTLLDWNAWRLFTNTAWNSAKNPYTTAYNNVGWWNTMSCQNFFCSADVGDSNNGGVIPGLAFYGAKDDASHNYNYSFSAMLFMVSTSVPASMQTANKCYFNIGTGNQIIDKP